MSDKDRNQIIEIKITMGKSVDVLNTTSFVKTCSRPEVTEAIAKLSHREFHLLFFTINGNMGKDIPPKTKFRHQTVKIIREELKMNGLVFRDIINKFKELNILVPLGKRTYFVNPFFIYKRLSIEEQYELNMISKEQYDMKYTKREKYNKEMNAKASNLYNPVTAGMLPPPPPDAL